MQLPDKEQVKAWVELSMLIALGTVACAFYFALGWRVAEVVRGWLP